jgi:DNA-binding transcriptional LysR family regulator
MHSLLWTDLQHVLAVADHASLAAAARALGVNHTTVLRRVRAFEKSVGV